MAGRLNQKYSSDGFTRSVGYSFATDSWPNRVIMCSNFAPTRSRICFITKLTISLINIPFFNTHCYFC
ncbi:hypothetical protein MtrunA17_Chr2g0291451 [Medicago truncatula]|uniref:Uncharacterized protein n=1 Tax=Medicago truncatula TaxID=3880 RepID=A0A396J8M6_MEDTR|nr:hypothetical protein MtrunA17_Chr2g0291451 [Medicago truncatula]